ncbi:endonuclease/exonuclease/phosphatase family protein [Nocardioides sp. NPDC101246]|uniref:endonuclease/exonuclease/phosphatase family protein n=1 Tax=Nocardioides sp. NPDC101246 TaxID=3364336 RepID=UPI003825CD53
MSNYAKANRTAQWFQDDYPGSVLNLTADTMVLVVHTTEGMTWPGYNGGATAPNYTGQPPVGDIKGAWRAHFPDERSSRALRNLSGGVQTNTLNAEQVELIGTCDPAHARTWGSKRAGIDYVYWPKANDEQLRWLADFIADMHKRHGLRLTFPTFKAYPGSYGANGVRLSFAQWRNYAGICGHQHVPENVHGDPGNIKMAKVIAFAKEMLSPAPPPAPDPVTTHTRWATRETGVHATPGGKLLRKIPEGYKFQVVDGSGHGNDGWVGTSAGNWVLGKDTTVWDPAAPVRCTYVTWNVENKGDADAALDRAEVIKICADEKPHYFALQEVYRVDLDDIPGYQTYRAWDGYSADSENRGQAILVRNDVAIKVKQALEMQEEWTGPKMGLSKEPRVHRYVTGNYHAVNLPFATIHVPFPPAIEETRRAAVAWLKEMRAAHGCGVIVGDWNALADELQAKVGTPAAAKVDGGGLDRAVFVGMEKVSSKNLGNRGRSDHPVKIWVLEA